MAKKKNTKIVPKKGSKPIDTKSPAFQRFLKLSGFSEETFVKSMQKQQASEEEKAFLARPKPKEKDVKD